MNHVHSFINQQVGFAKWKKCESSLEYLRCTKGEDFKCILPHPEDGFHPALVDPPIFACKFAQKEGFEHILALANEDGKIAIHNTAVQQNRFGVLAHHNAIFDLAWMFKQMKLVSVSGDHSAKLFDVTNSRIVEQQVFNGHTRSVKTVAFRQNDYSGFATGGRDGSIFIWDARTQHPTGEIVLPDDRMNNAHLLVKTPSSNKKRKVIHDPCSVSGANSVTGLVYQDDITLISCGAGDGIIKIWDMRKTYSVHKRDPVPKCTLPYAGPTARNGFSNLILDSSCLKLYANCLDNTIYCYNVGTYHPVPIMEYTGLQNSTFYVKSSLSRDGNYLISGSSDHNSYIWDTTYSRPILSLTGHIAEVTCVAWCQKDEPVLVTCSDDLKHKIWRVGTEIPPENWEIDGCGSAQVFPRDYSSKTPSSKRRASAFTEDEDSVYYSRWKHRKIWLDCPCGTMNLVNPNNFQCRRCGKNSKKHEAADEAVGEKKKIRFDKGPKRLFSPIDQNVPSSSGPELACVLEQEEYASEEVNNLSNPMSKCGIQNGKENDVFKLTIKVDSACRKVPDGPVAASSFEEGNNNLKAASIDEPPSADTCFIDNLPNFAVDGCAPHVNISPLKHKDKDWLTKLRIEKSITKDAAAAPSAPKIIKLELTTSPRNVKSHRPHSSTSRSPLLKFFRITNSSSSTSNQQCTPKSPNVSLPQQTQSPT